MMQKAAEYFRDYLKEKGFRQTKQREAILDLFLSKKGHICTDELYYLLRKKYPRLGYTTVYRTLKLLENAQIASEVNFTGKRKRFEPAFERLHHEHLICLKCGKIIEFLDKDFEKKQEEVCRKFGFKGTRHMMQIFGFCRKCRKAGKENVS